LASSAALAFASFYFSFFLALAAAFLGSAATTSFYAGASFFSSLAFAVVSITAFSAMIRSNSSCSNLAYSFLLIALTGSKNQN